MSKQVQNSKSKKPSAKKGLTSPKKIVPALFSWNFNIFKKPLLLVYLILLIVFLLINVISSQTISLLYFSVLGESRKATVVYLKKIMSLPLFKTEFDKFKTIYGNDIEKQVYAEKYQRQKQIIILETLLQKNSQARDVLFALYQLYLNDGQVERAQEYLKKAQQIDPMIKQIQNPKL